MEVSIAAKLEVEESGNEFKAKAKGREGIAALERIYNRKRLGQRRWRWLKILFEWFEVSHELAWVFQLAIALSPIK